MEILYYPGVPGLFIAAVFCSSLRYEKHRAKSNFHVSLLNFKFVKCIFVCETRNSTPKSGKG